MPRPRPPGPEGAADGPRAGLLARASLVEDGGAAAASPGDFFRSPEFLAAEGVTHSLLIEGEGWREALPLIVREIPGEDARDATSPYGYPGASDPPDDPPPPERVDWRDVGLVTVFVRERIDGRTCLRGGIERARVHVADPRFEPGLRKRLREQIRRNLRRGWAVERVPAPEASRAQRAAFRRAYEQTMVRAGASPRYFFGPEYFDAILSTPRAWLLLARREGAAPAAGAIAVASDGHLHYLLGGTADEALAHSPMKNLFAAMIELGGELRLPLNLGGGGRGGDSLDRFKRGFANAEASFLTQEVVCDPGALAELGAAAAVPEGFFPPYRAEA